MKNPAKGNSSSAAHLSLFFQKAVKVKGSLKKKNEKPNQGSIYIYWQYLMINESATAINLLKTKLFL